MPQPTQAARLTSWFAIAYWPHVDAHLAVGRAVAARDAHVLLHRDAEAAELLDEAEQRRHRAAEAAPDARAHERVEATPMTPENMAPIAKPYQSCTLNAKRAKSGWPLADAPSSPRRSRSATSASERAPRGSRPSRSLQAARRLVREVPPRLAGGVGEAAAAADPRAVEALAEEVGEEREGHERAEERPGQDQERLLQDQPTDRGTRS